MISVNDFKTGLTIELDNGLWSVVEFLHVKPGKGSAFVRSKLKNVMTQHLSFMVYIQSGSHVSSKDSLLPLDQQTDQVAAGGT